MRLPYVLDQYASRHTTFLRNSLVREGKQRILVNILPGPLHQLRPHLLSYSHQSWASRNSARDHKAAIEVARLYCCLYPASSLPRKQRPYAWLDASSHSSLTYRFFKLHHKKGNNKRLIHAGATGVQPLHVIPVLTCCLVSYLDRTILLTCNPGTD